MTLDFSVYASKGSFGEEAAKQYLSDFDLDTGAKIVFTGDNIDDWINAMLQDTGFGIVPYINSTKWIVHKHVSKLVSPGVLERSVWNLDSKFDIIGEHCVRVNFDLYANQHIELSDLDKNISYPILTKRIALQQAEEFLHKHGIRTNNLIDTDTAKGLVKCAEMEDLALALTRSGNTHEGTYLLAANIEPSRFNSTRFMVMINKAHPDYHGIKQKVNQYGDKSLRYKKLFLFNSLNEIYHAGLLSHLYKEGLHTYRTHYLPSREKKENGRVFMRNERIMEIRFNRGNQRDWPEKYLLELFEHILGEEYARERVAILGIAPRCLIKDYKEKTDIYFARE